jgi:hypothetical protein
MDISKCDKADVLRVLYNRARVQGMGFLNSRAGEMTKGEATELLKECTYFDYLYGRVIKISMKTDELDTGLYNRDNGPMAAEKAIAEFLEEQK